MTTRVTLILNLTRISENQLLDIRSHATLHNINLHELIEAQLLAWLRARESKFEDVGLCPSCLLNDTRSILKGMAVVDAEREGLVKIGKGINWETLDKTLYVVCLKCLWQGVPERSHLKSCE